MLVCDPECFVKQGIDRLHLENRQTKKKTYLNIPRKKHKTEYPPIKQMHEQWNKHIQPELICIKIAHYPSLDVVH